MLASVRQRLRRKLSRLSAVVPVLAGALAVSVLLGLLAWLVGPHLPRAFTDFLRELAAEDFDTRRQAIKAWFDAWGAVSAWVFLGVQFLQVVVAPIPGQFVGMRGCRAVINDPQLESRTGWETWP